MSQLAGEPGASNEEQLERESDALGDGYPPKETQNSTRTWSTTTAMFSPEPLAPRCLG